MSVHRLRIDLVGAVQGVGFRPFVYRLARELGLNGKVQNNSTGLAVEVEGPLSVVRDFCRRLMNEKPAAAVILAQEAAWLAPAGYTGFEIAPSEGGIPSAAVLPDLATCPQCLEEVQDAACRRYRYPFTNCTLCGPRFTIVLDIPYDRPNTTMRGFALCPACEAEYRNPQDRRFHAQPIACPQCGPRLWLEPGGPTKDPIQAAAEQIRRGKIVALKGIGGFQLLADARNASVAAELRRRKRREAKPFAVMMPSLIAVREYCVSGPEEEAALTGSAAPIVLLRARTGGAALPPEVAGESPYLGVMLPYSPLHHLLMEETGFPVIATSGNLSDEPIVTDNQEARERLREIADCFLLHDRPIARACDDSVVRLSGGRQCVLRRARGFAPLPVRVSRKLPSLLAVGGHLKNTVAIARDHEVYLSQHIGDLDTAEARRAFERAIEDLCRLYRFEPEFVVCDLHPDYASTQWARACGRPVIAVQHHMAHVAACAAENDLQGAYLGVAWDGTGYGTDHTVWGGEIFLVDGARFDRVSHLRPFRLPGGERAVKEPWRCAEAILFELGLEGRDSSEPVRLVRQLLERNVHAPVTTSAGRLFDAVASLLGLAHRNRFEGQAAMLLEKQIYDLGLQPGEAAEERYPMPVVGPVADFGPLIHALLEDHRKRVPIGRICLRFHNALASWIRDVAKLTGVRQAALSGGVFQNAWLTETTRILLERERVRVAVHQRIPPNDGGLALGQAAVAAAKLEG